MSKSGISLGTPDWIAYGRWIFDGLVFYIQKKNALTRTHLYWSWRWHITWHGRSGGCGLQKAVSCDLGSTDGQRRNMQIPTYCVPYKCFAPFTRLSVIITDKTEIPNRMRREMPIATTRLLTDSIYLFWTQTSGWYTNSCPSLEGTKIHARQLYNQPSKNTSS